MTLVNTHDTTMRPTLRFPATRALEVIDSHTCGQPTRVILNGAGLTPGADPDAARAQMAAERDWVRRVAVFEPRGSRSMFAAALIPPGPECEDFGVVFMDAMAYPDMCGHATIGVATTLFELGLVGPEEDGFSGAWEIGLRTPAGRVGLRATLVNGRCEAIAFRTPLAFHLGAVTVPVAGRPARVHVAYGGQWYAFVSAEAAGLTVRPDSIDALIAAAEPVRAALAAALDLKDPRDGRVPEVGNIVWTDTPRHPEAHGLNVPVSRAGSFDRSPCGTATCARMATLVAIGALAPGIAFVNEGLMGTLYRGLAVRPITEGGVSGIVPEVEGSAWITARAQLRADERDPLRAGYLVGGGETIV